MPDRVIRDELLESDRWLGLARSSHRLAYIVLLLRCDPLGNLEATDWQLTRMWRDACGATSVPITLEILEALVNADLVRLYDVGGKRHLHIPRTRFPLRYVRRVVTPSPWTTDAQREVLDKPNQGLGGNSQCEHGVKGRCEQCEHLQGQGKDKDKKKNTVRSAHDEPTGFAAFWKAFPATRRRVAKTKCLEFWKREHCEEIADEIVGHVRAMSATEQWRDGYEPAPLTYLHQRRWNDGVPEKALPQRPKVSL